MSLAVMKHRIGHNAVHHLLQLLVLHRVTRRHARKLVQKRKLVARDRFQKDRLVEVPEAVAPAPAALAPPGVAAGRPVPPAQLPAPALGAGAGASDCGACVGGHTLLRTRPSSGDAKERRDYQNIRNFEFAQRRAKGRHTMESPFWTPIRWNCTAHTDGSIRK